MNLSNAWHSLLGLSASPGDDSPEEVYRPVKNSIKRSACTNSFTPDVIELLERDERCLNFLFASDHA
jgi:hypothetical protein